MKPVRWHSLWQGLGDATRVSLIYVLVSMIWILASDALVGLVTSDTAQLARMQTYKGLLFVAVTALVIRFTVAGALASAQAEQFLQANAVQRAGSRAKEKLSPLRSAWAPLGAFGLLAVASAGIGNFTYNIGEQWIKDDREHELAAIADLKVNQIATWMAERRADAQSVVGSAFFGPAMRDWLQRGAPANETRDKLLRRLSVLRVSTTIAA